MSFTIVEENNEKVLTKCEGEMGIVEIPEGVTVIGDGNQPIFADYERTLGGDFVRGVKIPSSVKKISDGAFYRTCVDHVVFSEGLEEIGAGAFRKSFTGHGNVQKEIRFPKSLKVIGEGAFSATKIKRVYLSENVKVDVDVFPDGTDVVFFDEEGNTSLDRDVCGKAFKLEDDEEELQRAVAEAEERQQQLKAEGTTNNLLIELFASAPERCCTITGTRNKALQNLSFHPEFPEEEGIVHCFAIGDHAFENCNLLRSVDVSENIKRIGSCAFANENLEYALLPIKCKFVKGFDDSDNENSFLTTCDVFKYDSYREKDTGITKYILKKYYGTKNIVSVPEKFSKVDGNAFDTEVVSAIIIPENCKVVNGDVLDDCVNIYNDKGMFIDEI